MSQRMSLTTLVLIQFIFAFVLAQPVQAVGVGSLSGSVFVDGNGNALAEPGESIVVGATVHVRSQANPLFELTVQTDSNGYFLLNNVPYGIYDVWAVAENQSGAHLLTTEVAEVSAPVLLDVPVSDISASAQLAQPTAIFLPLVVSSK